MIKRGLASGLASQLASSVANNSNARGPAYDPDAADYFARAEALGGSFDLTAISGTYTEAYSKNAWNTFFAGIRAAGLRTGPEGAMTTGGVIHEAYGLHGVTYAGITAKLWYVSNPVVTLVGFNSGNYVAAGVGGGLGNGFAHRLDTNYSQANIAARDSHLCIYLPFGSVTGAMMGSESATNTNQLAIFSLSATVPSFRDSATNVAVSPTIASLNGIHIATSLTNNRYYYNGGLAGSSVFSGSPRTPSAFNTFMFGLNRGGTAVSQGVQRPVYGSQGSGLTEAQALAYSTLINQLATAFGVNSY